jgi:hypothetical protein
VGRLKQGVTQGQAEAALDAVAGQAEHEFGDADRDRKGRRVVLVSGGKQMPLRKQDGLVFTEFFIVLGGMVLLIACANLANMMLARGVDRRPEIAVRLSVGASRLRLVRQLLTESLLLSVAAGLIGFCLSVWVMRGASQLRMPYPVPVRFDLTPDAGAFLFTLILATLAALAFGLAPAWRATRADISSALKQSGAVRFRRFRRFNLRNVLVLSEVAGSLALLIITGYLALGSQSSLDVDSGFDPRNIYLISVDPVRDGYSAQQTTALFEKLLQRLKAVPGIVSVALTDTVPASFNAHGQAVFSIGEASSGNSRVVHSAQKFDCWERLL